MTKTKSGRIVSWYPWWIRLLLLPQKMHVIPLGDGFYGYVKFWRGEAVYYKIA